MKKNITVCLLILLVSSYGCKKEEDVYVRSGTVILGDYTHMVRQIYDSVIVFNGKPAFLDLDLDHDNMGDIRIISDRWGSNGIGYHPVSKLLCMTNSASVSGFFRQDTMFMYANQTSYIGEDGKVHLDVQQMFSCTPMSDRDTILAIYPDMFKFSVLTTSDKINQETIFKTDTLVLSDDSYELPPVTVIQHDTVMRIFVFNYKNCNTFPQEGVNYIGIRMRNGNEVRYGWIKLSITERNKIIVYETAMQE